MNLAKLGKFCDRKYRFVLKQNGRTYLFPDEPKLGSGGYDTAPGSYDVFPTSVFGEIPDLADRKLTAIPRALEIGDFVRVWKYDGASKPDDFAYGYLKSVASGEFTIGGSSETFAFAEIINPATLKRIIE